MQKIVFEDTTVVKKPYITIDGIEHDLQDGEYQGGTDLNAQTFNTMQNNIETAINEIISSGSNANGNWIKYSDGTMICWGRRTINNINISNSWGAMYESSTQYDFGKFPQTFISMPSISFTCYEGVTTLLEIINGLSTTDLGKVQLMCPVTRSNATSSFTYTAIGKWK